MRIARFGSAAFAVIVAAAALPAAPAAAATDWEMCGKQSGDTAIAGCSRAIGSARYAGKDLAVLYFNRAVEYLNRKDYDRAVTDYNESIRLDPKVADAYAGRGRAWRLKEDYDRALTDLDAAIRLNPKDANAHDDRGMVWHLKNEFDRAIVDFSEALRLDPKNARAYQNRAIAYREKGDNDRAIADYSAAIRVEPSFQSFVGRGNRYSAKRDYDRAIADYTEAIRLDPKQALAYNNRGVAWRQKADYDRAIADYTEAIRREPTAARYTNRGYAWYQKKDYDLAIADYGDAIRLEPNDAAVYDGRGDAYSAKKEYARAIANYTEAIRIDPKGITYYKDRARAYSAQKDFARAIADYDRVFEIRGTVPFEDFVGRAFVYRESGNFPAALDDLQRAKALIAAYKGSDPSPAMTYYFNLGRTLHAMGKYDDAIAAFSAGMPEQPDYYWAYYYRALSYEKTGQRDKVVADLTTAAGHIEQKNWSDELRAKLAEYNITAAAAAPVVPAIAAAAPAGRFMIAVTSQRSQADAASAYRALQARYRGQLGDRQPVIRRVDLGSKGIYFRAEVGPFGTKQEGVRFCDDLKAAGGACTYGWAD
jgi:tetratricopeptide (TPR) repeat protein